MSVVLIRKGSSDEVPEFSDVKWVFKELEELFMMMTHHRVRFDSSWIVKVVDSAAALVNIVFQ